MPHSVSPGWTTTVVYVGAEPPCAATARPRPIAPTAPATTTARRTARGPPARGARQGLIPWPTAYIRSDNTERAFWCQVNRTKVCAWSPQLLAWPQRPPPRSGDECEIDRRTHRTADPDPRLHPRGVQEAELPAQRAGDRRGGRPQLQLDGPQPPEPARAARPDQARPQQVANRPACRRRRDGREAAQRRLDPDRRQRRGRQPDPGRAEHRRPRPALARAGQGRLLPAPRPGRQHGQRRNLRR